MFIKGRKVGSKCNKCTSEVIWGSKGSYELCCIVLSFCLCLMERLSSSTVVFTSIVILTFKMIQSILWCHQWCNSIWRNAPLKRKQGRRLKRRQFVFCYESCLDHGRPLERHCSSLSHVPLLSWVLLFVVFLSVCFGVPLSLDWLLMTAWRIPCSFVGKILGMVCYYSFPRDERKWQAQGHPLCLRCD